MPERETEAPEAMETTKPTDGAATAEAGDEATEAATPAKPKRKPKAAAKARAKDADPLDVPLFDSAGALQGEVRLPKVIFAEKVNTPVMHQAYVRQANNARQGTASTKTRATISGGGAKPYRQKGTGRARHGSTREPSMKGGAVVFGPHPRSYAQRMPKQMRRLALRSALTQKATEGKVRVIAGFDIEEPKTSVAADLMDAIGFDDTTLVVLPAPNFVVTRSFENLTGTKIILARNLNIRDLFTHTYLLLAKDCLELLEENFSKPERPKAGAANHDHGGTEPE
ncbi:MAG TPA: 50S ribosomal protein L4 [Candidatus Nitrosopolaris sp.]|nr:50S ribosomal protein L4 [Candidatus Nitrosopolaris sp.]